jgi:hypothetical protein
MARSKNISDLDNKILNALKKRPLSTKVLADAVGEDKKRVYGRCRRLERDGSLESSLVPGARLLYCVDDQRVVTGAEYEACKDENHDLRAFFNEERLWRLTASAGSPVGGDD